MPKKGENIYKRADGRWEGRYIKTHAADGKAKYGYVYAKTYREVKSKLIDAIAKCGSTQAKISLWTKDGIISEATFTSLTLERIQPC